MLSPILMGAGSCLNPLAPEQDTGLKFCSRRGLFHCGTVAGPQLLQEQGFTGYCTVEDPRGGMQGATVGYSGWTSGGGITPATWSSSEAWNYWCGASGVGGRGICNTVTTCYRE
ncbi:MAG: hypothetical protein IT405_03190 [Candidatus Yanofskybacteria bacterium]|nr:hypothetical protein [Candidatus Yanofskybacteria bacterium]